MFQHLAPQTLFSLKGRVVFMTGGAGGIASGLARGFAAAGARLVLVDRDPAVQARAAELRDAGAEASARVLERGGVGSARRRRTTPADAAAPALHPPGSGRTGRPTAAPSQSGSDDTTVPRRTRTRAASHRPRRRTSDRVGMHGLDG